MTDEMAAIITPDEAYPLRDRNYLVASTRVNELLLGTSFYRNTTVHKGMGLSSTPCLCPESIAFFWDSKTGRIYVPRDHGYTQRHSGTWVPSEREKIACQRRQLDLLYDDPSLHIDFLAQLQLRQCNRQFSQSSTETGAKAPATVQAKSMPRSQQDP